MNKRKLIEQACEFMATNGARVYGLRSEHPIETEIRRNIDKKILDALFSRIDCDTACGAINQPCSYN